MKQKTEVLQGTLALMVLKTLDVLGPQHGYGIARRIEQISGDLLAVNQGTLYPVLLKLEQEGAMARRRPTAPVVTHQVDGNSWPFHSPVQVEVRVGPGLEHRQVRIEGADNFLHGLDQLQRLAARPQHQDHSRDRMLGRRQIHEIHRLFGGQLMYGLVAYNVSRRTHEIGIRMALGAGSSDVLRLVMGKGLVLVGMGTVIGLAMGFAVEQLMNSMLFNAGGVDIVAYMIVVPSLFLVTMLAAYLPARSASRIAPTQALRYGLEDLS
jgi:Transcriptional regulator PadR-like family/FtsX-like permease family